MKAKDLKWPFDWEKRHVLLEDRILWVPKNLKRYEDFKFPGWNDPVVFPKEQPIKVEYCSGNGTWIIDKAQNHPHYNWVAVEIDFERVRKIWAKLKNLSLTNLLIICGDAYTSTSHYFPSNSVDQIFVNFPDPWPKRRHAKNRLFHPHFIKELVRVSHSSGKTIVVTDDEDYSNRIIGSFNKEAGFISCSGPPHYVTEMEGYGSSFFEELWRKQGKTIRYHCYKKA